MKPEIALALQDYEEICKNPYKYTPEQLKKLEEKLKGYITPKKWVRIECLESARDNILKDGRASIYGGKYNVTDNNIGKEFTLDMDKGILIASGEVKVSGLIAYKVLTNIFIYDYTDFPHVLYPANKLDADLKKEEEGLKMDNEEKFEKLSKAKSLQINNLEKEIESLKNEIGELNTEINTLKIEKRKLNKRNLVLTGETNGLKQAIQMLKLK